MTPPSYEDNSNNVVIGANTDSTAVLNGFTIRGGYARSSGDEEIQAGSGIYVGDDTPLLPGEPTIRHCIIKENFAPRGALFVAKGNFFEIRDCWFIDNRATYGAGMFADTLDTRIVNCHFIRNKASDTGGYVSDSTAGARAIVNCEFIGNVATGGNGGGMSTLLDSGVEITNCLFAGNTASGSGGAGHGGGLYAELIGVAEHAKINDCTFADNHANVAGGGIALVDNSFESTAVLQNTIVWGNTSGSAVLQEDQVYPTGPWSATYCDIQAASTVTGAGNRNVDPYFVNPPSSYRLLPSSDCIDHGSNGLLPPDTMNLDGDLGTTTLNRDLDLVERIQNGNGENSAVVDMGAYEAPTIETCPGDLDDSTCINGIDLALFLGEWTGVATYAGCPSTFNPADITHDCKVNGLDLAYLLGRWGPCRDGSCEEPLIGGGDSPETFWTWWMTGDLQPFFDWLAEQS